ncbi:MAG: cupin domain-containing protein [Rhodanobacteraceae bacterium]
MSGKRGARLLATARQKMKGVLSIERQRVGAYRTAAAGRSIAPIVAAEMLHRAASFRWLTILGGVVMSTRTHRSAAILKLATATAAVLLCASAAQAQPPTQSGASVAPPKVHGRLVDPRTPLAPTLVKQLMTRAVVGLPGKEVVVSTIEYPPGASSPPHRHDAQVFVYVLQGRVIMQVKGGPRMTLGPGQMFYENPSDIHIVSANASKTKPARFLAFLIKDKDKPATLPVTSGQAQ